nr:MAG TPA: protein of unknown function (DUF3480) [Caudoviricetes sp.]
MLELPIRILLQLGAVWRGKPLPELETRNRGGTLL